MIIAAGLSPAWQQILVFDNFETGEVNRAQQAIWCASGKVINVAIALNQLGADCQTVCLTGGDSGQAIEKEFATAGYPAAWVPSSSSTRVCTTIIDQATKTTTELVENCGPASTEELDHFANTFAEQSQNANCVVLTGSLPAETPANYYRSLLAKTNARAILDFRGPELMAALQQQPFVVKPNREELAATVGHAIETDAQLLSAMRSLNEKGASWVVVTDGGKAVWATSQTDAYRATPPVVDVVNPIGCGDCFTAGLALGLSENDDMQQALAWGMAAAAENLKQLLPARVDRQTCENLADEIVVESVSV